MGLSLSRGAEGASTEKAYGFSLIEVVIGLGILGLALLTLLTLCTTVLRYQRQSTNVMNATRVNDMVAERAVATLAQDSPTGSRDTFWASSYPYPSSPFLSGTEQVGRQTFNFAVHATDIPGLGDAGADPPNLLRRVDVYVSWDDGQGAERKTVMSTRLINSGDQP